MAKALSKANISNIHKAQERIDHFANILSLKEKDDPNLAPWLAEKSSDYYRGMLEASYNAIEDLLLSHNVYGGFKEVDVKGTKVRHYFLYKIK